VTRVRFSGSSLVYTEGSSGQIALLLNKAQLKKGKRVLTPIGGTLEVSCEVGQTICQELGLTLEDFDKLPKDNYELRFMVDEEHLPSIRRQFPSWDSGPEREMYEELVDETWILKSEQLGNSKLKLAGFHEIKGVSDRPGREGEPTIRRASVYVLPRHADFSPTLDEAAKAKSPLLYFVTREEIKRERAHDGTEIASISKLLLKV